LNDLFDIPIGQDRRHPDCDPGDFDIAPPSADPGTLSARGVQTATARSLADIGAAIQDHWRLARAGFLLGVIMVVQRPSTRWKRYDALADGEFSIEI
jgi:hypothetical protein